MEKVANPARRGLLSGRVRSEQQLRLPWVTSEKQFIDQCTQCQDCIEACQPKIIVRDALGYPKVDFSQGECDFCHQCIKSCKQPFFTPAKTREFASSNYQRPWPALLEISEQCLAKNSIYCQSCRDECHANAVTFSYIVAGKTKVIPQPSINLPDCDQCGACLSSCPQQAISFQIQPNGCYEADYVR